MKPEQQIISIAEACGWILKPRLFHNGEWKEVPTWVQSKYYKDKPDDYCMSGQWLGAMPPDYLNNLNDIHEAEKVLQRVPTARADQQVLFADILFKIISKELGRVALGFDIAHATGPQRVEAFLRTIGMWKE